METVNDRIQSIVDSRFGGNKAAFARAIGVPVASISNYIGKHHVSKPSVDMLVKIVNTLGVDALWLLTGRKEVEGETAAGECPILAASGGVAFGNDERVIFLEKLLAEKERTIKILMGLSKVDEK